METALLSNVDHPKPEAFFLGRFKSQRWVSCVKGGLGSGLVATHLRVFRSLRPSTMAAASARLPPDPLLCTLN